jgi:agmatinase
MKTIYPFNFGGLPKKYSEYKNAKIAVLPIPFDLTSTWQKGADKGPHAIIDASRNVELYDIETNSEVYKKGICTLPEIKAKSSSEMIKKSYSIAKKAIQDNKLLVSIGGEHSISIGLINAFAEDFKDLSILHLDAHSDRRDSYEDSKFSHACVMARAGEVVKNIISVGIRSLDAVELKNIDQSKMFYAHQIYGSKDWIKKAVKKLSKNVYISIDLDVFDQSIMPSTGTPEPGGLNWYDVTNLLKETAKNCNIVGLDVVELCPSKNKAPDFLAAKLIYVALSYIYSNPSTC